MSLSRSRLRPRRQPVAAAVPGPAVRETGGFRADLRAVLFPERAWHHVFPAVVLLTGLAYWLISLFVQPGASWAEIALYRPQGDSQIYPVITALSQFNLGDPTDAVVQGRGVGGFQAVILVP